MNQPDKGTVLPSLQGRVLPALFTSTLLLAACSPSSGEKSAAAPSARGSASSSPAPPVYSIKQLEGARLSATEIGYGVKQHTPGLVSLTRGEIPVCSLGGLKPYGKPLIDIRQFSKPTPDFSGANYARVVARYENHETAKDGFDALRKRISACPKTQDIPQKRVKVNFIQFAHRDTWRTTNGTIQGWQHIRGHEKQIAPPSATKLNVTHLLYDYTFRGNVIIASLYWERVEPTQSSDPITERATSTLKKQLTKIG